MNDKKHKVKIETLTLVHVGSGENLRKDTDFFFDNGNICIIDERKLLDVIGKDNLYQWLNLVERSWEQQQYRQQRPETVKQLVNRIKRNCPIERYTKRHFKCLAVEKTNTMRECIHDGMGKPYIPGSSIKGAIRTAILTSIAKDNAQQYITFNGNNIDVNDSDIFGNSANNSVFRFLQIGDAIFNEGDEVATRLVLLNIHGNNGLFDDGHHKDQLVEAISYNKVAYCNIKINNIANKSFSEQTNGETKSLPSVMQSPQSLFKAINEHTRRLLEGDIEFWNEYEGDEFKESYIKSDNEILAIIKTCKSNECVLRLGHASGWNFITGGWAKEYPEFERRILSKARPGNRDRYYQYPFPKSRRVEDDGRILGFVKLSLMD